jgi:lipoyl(octanoyl) transferase
LDRQPIFFHDWGTITYDEAWKLQENLLQKNVILKTAARMEMQAVDPFQIPTKHHLVFCEHPPVFTLGKSGNISNVLISESEMESKGISFYRTNRGGDITFHGQGQIVGYPILDLEKLGTDIGLYLRNVEEVIIRTLFDFGIIAGRSKGETGVWIDADEKGKERKICAIGVRCSRWITMHGFALNVNTDLSYFNHIIPCGIENKQVTSIQKELGKNVDINEVKKILLKYFAEVFLLDLLLAES